MQLADSKGEIGNNQPVRLLLQITNVSPAPFYVVETHPKYDCVFLLTTTAGQQIKLGDELHMEAIRRVARKLKPNGVIGLRFNLSELYPSIKAGRYSLVVKRRVLLGDGKSCELTSNTLKFTIK